jgi:hypothetical protein
MVAPVIEPGTCGSVAKNFVNVVRRERIPVVWSYKTNEMLRRALQQNPKEKDIWDDPEQDGQPSTGKSSRTEETTGKKLKRKHRGKMEEICRHLVIQPV